MVSHYQPGVPGSEMNHGENQVLARPCLDWLTPAHLLHGCLNEFLKYKPYHLSLSLKLSTLLIVCRMWPLLPRLALVLPTHILICCPSVFSLVQQASPLSLRSLSSHTAPSVKPLRTFQGWCRRPFSKASPLPGKSFPGHYLFLYWIVSFLRRGLSFIYGCIPATSD